MEARPQQLSLDEIHLLRWFLGGVVMLLSIATVFYMDIDSDAMAAVAMAGVLVALARPALPARVPLLGHRLAFPLILAFFAGDLWRTGQILPAIVRLDLLLLLYRGISHRARRDDLQIVVLGLFLIVVAGVLTVSLLFAGQILVFTACALGFLLVITIAASTEGGQAPILAVRGVVPSWAAHADWGRLFVRLRQVSDWRLVVSAIVLFLGVAAVSGLLFLAIPRFQLENSLFLERFVPKRAMTGFSDSIKFGDITDIQQDDSIALDVDLSDPSQAPANPYWRMVVLDDYRNGAFRLSSRLRAAFDKERTGTNILPLVRVPRDSPTWTFYLESGISRYLPLLGHFEALHFRDAQNYRFSTDLGLLALRDEPATMTAYRVEGMAANAAELPDRAYAGRWKNRTLPRGMPLQWELDLPHKGDKEELAGLAAQVGPVGPDFGDFARRASAWLRRQHGYTLSPKIPAGPQDPLVRWMSSREPGHCELFAGALVLLARSAGIPARVVTGFKGGTWNAYSGNYTIRNSDAHAWAEVWEPQKGAWLREDPLETAAAEDASGDRGAAALAGLMDRSWSARWTSLRIFWYRRIVNFDQQSQVDTLRAVKAATDNSGKWLQTSITEIALRVKGWFLGRWDLARILRLAAVAGAAASLVWVFITGRWRLAGVVRGRKVDPVRREAGRWLIRLDGPPNLVADLQRLRYGPAPSWPRPSEVFRRARKSRPSSRRRQSASSRSTS
jgi:transglutaminase-like putative cysteine protease